MNLRILRNRACWISMTGPALITLAGCGSGQGLVSYDASGSTANFNLINGSDPGALSDGTSEGLFASSTGSGQNGAGDSASSGALGSPSSQPAGNGSADAGSQ